MSAPDEAPYDDAMAAEVIGRAAGSPGGPAMVVSMLSTLPSVSHTPARKGLFRSNAELVLVGSWRYQVGADGRLHAMHVVGGIVIAEQQLSPAAAGRHVADAIAEHVAAHGEGVRPHVEAMLTVLATTGY